jgi:Nucleoside 2-deoxyribosyltransferase
MMTKGKHVAWWWTVINIGGSVASLGALIVSIVRGDWRTFITTFIVVVLVVGTSWWIRWRGRQPMHLFLSMQMSDLTNEEYVLVHQSIMPVVHDLRKLHKVYFFNEEVHRQEEFDERDFDARSYLAEIDAADVFVAIVTKKIVSSIYFEAGYALARGKRCLYFVTDDHLMPVLMRRVALSHENVRTCQTTDLHDIKATLRDVGWNDESTATIFSGR